MVGLFSFDGPLYCDKDGIYCNTTITDEVLKRYFVAVDKLLLLMRTVHVNKTYEQLHLKPLDLGNTIEVVELPNINTPKNYIIRARYKQLIEKCVKESDMFFLRIPSIISNMVASACSRHNKPYLAEVGGCAWDSYWNHGLTGKLIAPTMFFGQKRTVRSAAYASYVTEKWLQHRYPTNGESIVASNVYLNSFDTDNIDKRVKENCGKVTRALRLGTIASVDVRYKGQELVIKAMGRLKKEGVELYYDLVGAGDPTFLKVLANKCGVQDKVTFHGVKVHDDIWEWLDTIDIYVQPSKQEGLPRAVIEAMNRGCLAIGSDVAGIPELLEDDMVFKRNSVEQICSVIRRIISEKNHERRIRRNFEETRKYEIAILNERRNQLFLKYKQLIINKYENS